MIKNYSKESLLPNNSVNNVLTSTLQFLMDYSKGTESLKLKKQRILICKN